MALYRRQAYGVWYYEFNVAGKRYRASTNTTDTVAALAIESKIRGGLEAVEARRQANDIGAVQSQYVWDVAISWLVHASVKQRNHRNNIGRVRKLFGIQMQLFNDEWIEVSCGYSYGLPRDLRMSGLTPEVLGQLAAARKLAGSSSSTVSQEQLLIKVLVDHAKSRVSPEVPQDIPVELALRQAHERHGINGADAINYVKKIF